jgi:hypothetical protein
MSPTNNEQDSNLNNTTGRSLVWLSQIPLRYLVSVIQCMGNPSRNAMFSSTELNQFINALAASRPSADLV